MAPTTAGPSCKRVCVGEEVEEEEGVKSIFAAMIIRNFGGMESYILGANCFVYACEG